MATTPLAGIQDLFEDGIALNGWTEVQTPTGWTIDETGGQLVVTVPSSQRTPYLWYSKAASESVDGRHVRLSVDMRSLSGWNASVDWSSEFVLAVYMTGNTGTKQFQVACTYSGGKRILIARYRNGAGFVSAGQIDFDPNTARHIEVAVDGGTVYGRVSADNTNWTTVGSVANPWDAAEMLSPTVHIYQGGGNIPTPGSWSSDEINPDVSTPSVVTVSGSEAFGLTEAVSDTWLIEGQDLASETLSLSESGGETITGTGATATFTFDYGETFSLSESGSDFVRSPAIPAASPPKSMMRYRRHR